MSHKTHNVHNNNIHDDFSHSFWNRIEDMKTPGISSLWIWPIYMMEKQEKKKVLWKVLIRACHPQILYILHTHTFQKKSPNWRKVLPIFLSFICGGGKGEWGFFSTVCPTSELLICLFGSWFVIFIITPYYHPLLSPCGTRVVIIEMWPHWPPCGRLLRNVVILEMWHLAFPICPFFLYSHFFFCIGVLGK